MNTHDPYVAAVTRRQTAPTSNICLSIWRNQEADVSKPVVWDSNVSKPIVCGTHCLAGVSKPLVSKPTV